MPPLSRMVEGCVGGGAVRLQLAAGSQMFWSDRSATASVRECHPTAGQAHRDNGVMEVDLSAGTFAYLDSETSGTPTVLLHAMGRSAADWQPVFARMPERFRLLALDMRGHGSSCRPGAYSFEAMRDDLKEFADALGLNQFNLAGHSMGATTSILFAEKWPSRIRRLILEDTPPPSGKEQIPTPPDQPSEPVEFDWRLVGPIIEQLNHPDPAWWSNLNQIAAPTLIVAGGEPSFIDQDELTRAVRRMPDARMVTIEAGHHIHSTRPDDFVAGIVGFLDER